MKEFALFFGPLNGSVHKVAKMIAAEIGEDKVDLIPVSEACTENLKNYDKLIFGISTVGKDTWDMEFSNTDWAQFFPCIRDYDFSGKKVAVFGLGDHLTYAYHFVDSMGLLAKLILKNNGTLVGKVDSEEYEFQDSEALAEGAFLGLPIDEDYESDKTPDRVQRWVKLLNEQF